jgi:hypothetical protein
VCFRSGVVCVEVMRTNFGGQLSYERIREGMRILEKVYFWGIGQCVI